MGLEEDDNFETLGEIRASAADAFTRNGIRAACLLGAW